MKSYTITVSPDDGRGAQTTVKVLTDGSTVTVTDVHLKAGSEGGLSSKRLPAVDLDLLLRAVLPATGRTPRSVPASDDAPKAGPAKAAAANAVPMNDAPADAAATNAIVTKAASTKAGSAKAAPTKATATKAARKTAVKSAPKPAKKSVAEPAKKSVAKRAKRSVAEPAAPKSAAKKTAPKSATTKTARADAGKAAATGRVYRMMPDDFVNTFGKTTMVDLADVYEVPLHTVQAWVNTARKQGKIPPARPRARAQAQTATEPPLLPPE